MKVHKFDAISRLSARFEPLKRGFIQKYTVGVLTARMKKPPSLYGRVIFLTHNIFPKPWVQIQVLS
jgi:hypothetical protein